MLTGHAIVVPWDCRRNNEKLASAPCHQYKLFESNLPLLLEGHPHIVHWDENFGQFDSRDDYITGLMTMVKINQ